MVAETEGKNLFNNVGIMGRFAQNPELRHTRTGVPIVSFTLAVDRDRKDRETGERETDWIDCIAWRSTAEFISRYFAKGQMALVQGRLQVRKWQDDAGHGRRTTEVVVDEIYFADAPRKAEGVTQRHPDDYAALPDDYPIPAWGMAQQAPR